MKPRVYVAGKLNSDAVGYVRNCHLMITEADKIRRAGYAVYVPCIDILMGMVMGDYQYNDYFDNSQPWLAASDAIYVMPSWVDSEGTKREISLANTMGIPVCFTIDELRNELPIL